MASDADGLLGMCAKFVTVQVRCPLGLSARVAKSADATDLKSVFPQGECGFNSRPGHQQLKRFRAGLVIGSVALEFIERRGGGYYFIGSRVSFESVVDQFLQGESPEGIVQSYPSLSLLQFTAESRITSRIELKSMNI